MKDNMKEMKENPIGNIKNGRTLSYDIVNQIERKKPDKSKGVVVG